MQNLTAKFNVLYNADILLNESEQNIKAAYFDNYSEILSVYPESTPSSGKAETANLDSVIGKANKIIIEKPFSYYIDRAYFLIAKSNYLKAEFYNAAEFFDYTAKTYPSEKELRQACLVGKTRALIQLKNFTEAESAIDTALKYIQTGKESTSDVFATKAQLLIKTNQEPLAIEMLKKALEHHPKKQNKVRWTYLLAQLQERNNDRLAAYTNYKKVSKSNAPYEMAFNANAARFGIEDTVTNKHSNPVNRLKSLLKNDNNKDFKDQIYYRIAEIYRNRQQISDAIENYNKAIRLSTKNSNQKGLAYLRLADINFNTANYGKAKLYYDSTLRALSPTYIDYERIAKKSSNLDLLANRLQTITTEETLQSLAKLPEKERAIRINELIRERSQTSTENKSGVFLSAIGDALTDRKFYFNNTTALSQGYSDFKKRWGNRKLEDNWRRSDKAIPEEITMSNSSDPDLPGEGITNTTNTNPKDILENIPLTAEQLKKSDQKIINAYYDIAVFYKDELKDYAEAIKTFEELLKRYPENNYKLAIYYNLYRLYQGRNDTKAEEYKNLLVSKYPDSPFAKAILDPTYSQKADEMGAALDNAYNEAYSLYLRKNYTGVLQRIPQIEQQFPNNKLSPQLAYLNALAVGRTQKLPEFENALKVIVQTYPDDKLITPLVNQHLLYISANRVDLNTRLTALTDFDPNAPRFVVEPEVTPKTTQKPTDNEKPEVTKPQQVKPEQAITELPPATNTLFNLPDSAEYYFVINVMDHHTTLSSSRFGIGQFNRSNYRGEAIKHQLKEINSENQLIFIGKFFSRSTVMEYEKNILPLIGNIMKIPANKYNTFVITQENLDKLNNSMMINSYFEFYKNTK